MLIPEFSDGRDRIQASVFSQGIRNDFQCLWKRSHAVRIHTRKSVCILCEIYGEFCLWGTTTCYECPTNVILVSSLGQSAEEGKYAESSCIWHYLFLTRHLTTHSASCRERSASSKTSLFDPRTNILTVLPGFCMPVICNEEHVDNCC